MKIKQVCEATGLTDRAIRYYIEEGLVAPAYTENYMAAMWKCSTVRYIISDQYLMDGDTPFYMTLPW